MSEVAAFADRQADARVSHQTPEHAMSEITRYDLAAVPNTYDNWHMQERSDGEYMRFADHRAALTQAEATIAELQRKLRQCAVAVCGCTTGIEATDMRQVGEAMEMPLDDIPDYVSDRVAGYERAVAQAEDVDCFQQRTEFAERELHAAEATIAGLREELAAWKAEAESMADLHEPTHQALTAAQEQCRRLEALYRAEREQMRVLVRQRYVCDGDDTIAKKEAYDDETDSAIAIAANIKGE